jgi:hypothetical protein
LTFQVKIKLELTAAVAYTKSDINKARENSPKIWGPNSGLNPGLEIRFITSINDKI